jgi:hypothetical protein
MLLVFLAAATCVDPVAFGAVANDGKPDHVAIQEAVEVAQRRRVAVCLGEGVWNLERTSRLGSITITGGPLEIRGAGPKTVLRMTGDGGRGDWRALQLDKARDVVLRDFAVDGLDATNTEEQTHLIEIGPGSRRVRLSNLTLGPMRRPDQNVGDGIGGDCIRLLGNPGAEVTDVVIERSHLTDCDRSGITLQRALRRVKVTDVTIRGVGDTPVDFEPTGAGKIEDVTFSRLTIQRPPDAQGAWAMTIGGVGADLARRITVQDSTLDGGIGMLNVADVTIQRNEIVHSAPGDRPTINVMWRGANVRILRNRISRTRQAGAGPVIRATHNNAHAPRGLVIEHNTLRQETQAATIAAISLDGLTVRGNRIEYDGTDPAPVVIADPVLQPVGDVVITGNRVVGRTAELIAIGARGERGAGRVVVRDNRVDGAPLPVRCNGAPRIRTVVVDRGVAEISRRCPGTRVRLEPKQPRRAHESP